MQRTAKGSQSCLHSKSASPSSLPLEKKLSTHPFQWLSVRPLAMASKADLLIRKVFRLLCPLERGRRPADSVPFSPRHGILLESPLLLAPSHLPVTSKPPLKHNDHPSTMPQLPRDPFPLSFVIQPHFHLVFPYPLCNILCIFFVCKPFVASSIHTLSR